jgi:hypothetical protein
MEIEIEYQGLDISLDNLIMKEMSDKEFVKCGFFSENKERFLLFKGNLTKENRRKLLGIGKPRGLTIKTQGSVLYEVYKQKTPCKS